MNWDHPRPARPRGHAEIKALAKERGVAIPELLVLARQNDPFVCGAPADVIRGEWFADLWQSFGYSGGVHLRRVHYQTLSSGLLCPDGSPYENTDACWSLLCNAGAAARALDLVAPDAFVDRKNALPVLNAGVPRLEWDRPRWEWTPSSLSLPEIKTDLGWFLDFTAGDIEIEGYDYERCDQPVLLEVWVEKSTMNDVLEPLCAQLGVNLVASSGFQSITNAVGLLTRAAQHDKPARAFYISDFDPAGDQMPIAVARQVEFWYPRFGKGVDLKITPLVLTRDQIDEYDLPRTPVKVDDRRRGNFEKRRGEGAVELDALEALHPGVLDQVVRQAITPYRDRELPFNLRQAENDAREAAEQTWEDATVPQRERLGSIQERAQAITATYEERLKALASSLAHELAPLQTELTEVEGDLARIADEVEIVLPARPRGEVEDVDEDGWLFDAGRDYFDQLDAYRKHKAGDYR